MATLKRPSGLLLASRSLHNKINIYFLKSAVRHSQGTVGAPHILENCRASDAQSVNVRRKVMDRRLICKHVCKPLYGPRPLILDLTTSTVEANFMRHPQGDTQSPRPQTDRMVDERRMLPGLIKYSSLRYMVCPNKFF